LRHLPACGCLRNRPAGRSSRRRRPVPCYLLRRAG